MTEFGVTGAFEGAERRVGPADGETVAAFRTLIRSWLDQTVDVDAQKLGDIILSTDEALSNCADHAYRDMLIPGDMAVSVHYDLFASAVVVSITDFGRWVEPLAGVADRRRGRGLMLMRALSDECTVHGGVEGTTVRLRFGNCRARVANTGAPTN